MVYAQGQSVQRSTPTVGSASSAGGGIKAGLRGMDYAAQSATLTPRAGPPVQLKTVQKKDLPQSRVDETFNSFYALEKKTPAGRSEAQIIERALQRTKGQIVVGIPPGYVPPPLRGGASAAAPVSTESTSSDPLGMISDLPEDGQCLDPNGQSVDPNLTPGPVIDEGLDPNGQSIDPNAGASTPADKAPDLEFGMAFPKYGPYGLELGANAKGDLSAAGKFDLKELQPLTIPIFTGVYAQLKPDLTGGYALKGNPKDNWVSLTGSLDAALAATLRVGLPNLASVGVGGELKGSIGVTAGWSEAKGWTVSPITIELSGALIGTGEIGPMEFKTTFGQLQLVTITIAESGAISAKPGAEVQDLWDKLTGWDKESYEYALGQCQEFQGNDDPNCSMGAGGGVAAPPREDGNGGGGGAGGAGGAGGQ